MQAQISVVLCTYNGAAYLREQLDSLMRQTLPIAELIIQDDASQDETWAIVSEYAQKYAFIKAIHHEQNVGFKENFASALQQTTGDFIAYCDQDDIWTDNHLEVLLDLIADKDLAVGNALLIDAQGQSMGFTLREEFRYENVAENDIDKLYPIFYRSSVHQGASMLIRRKLLDTLLPFPEDVAFHDVWTASLACCQSGLNDTEQVITLYRQHGKNVTTHAKPSLWRELKMRHHVTFAADRIHIYHALRERVQPKSAELENFLHDWKWYHDHAKLSAFRWQACKHRFARYKKIYTTKDFRYFCLRALQYILTPPFK